eukprot:2817801-Prymnesium_polylepis.1
MRPGRRCRVACLLNKYVLNKNTFCEASSKTEEDGSPASLTAKCDATPQRPRTLLGGADVTSSWRRVRLCATEAPASVAARAGARSVCAEP